MQVFTAFLLDIQHLRKNMKRTSRVSSLIVSLVKALNVIASTFELLGWWGTFKYRMTFFFSILDPHPHMTVF